LGIGVVLMLAALGLVGAVAVYALRPEERRLQAARRACEARSYCAGRGTGTQGERSHAGTGEE
jgi:hypothetical protein